MDYLAWRNDIFGQQPDADPGMVEMLPETYSVSGEEAFNHVDRALGDADIHRSYTRDQIGIGLQLIYSNCCSDICFCYVDAGDEARRVTGIRNLDKLYANFFNRYCVANVGSIGNDHLDGGIGYLCYMLWDIFVLYPGNASAAMASAALDVMAGALQMQNDNCIVSAIHGLGHWSVDDFRAKQILERWLHRPTSLNPVVFEYAKQATTGRIQ